MKYLCIVIDPIHIYLADRAIVNLVGRVDVMIAFMIMALGMVSGGKGVVKLPHCCRVEKYSQQ